MVTRPMLNPGGQVLPGLAAWAVGTEPVAPSSAHPTAVSTVVSDPSGQTSPYGPTTISPGGVGGQARLRVLSVGPDRPHDSSRTFGRAHYSWRHTGVPLLS
jgi:hypothetical protein